MKFFIWMAMRRLNQTFTILLLLMSVAALLCFSLNTVKVNAAGENWLTGWSYRKSHQIVGSTAGAQTDYQVRITVYYGSGTDSGGNVYLNGKCRTDFGDIRFTASDGSTLLAYWMESYTASSSAVFWVKVPSIPASPNTATIYIYYGKSDATTTSNGDATFLFFDDFPGTAVNTTKWTVLSGGSVSVSNGELVLTGDGSNRGKVASKTFQSTDYVRMRVKSRVADASESSLLAVLQHDKTYGASSNRPSNGFWHETYGTEFNIYKGVSNTLTKLTSVTYDFYPDTNYHILEFVKSGSSMKGYADGVLKTSVSDTTTFSSKYIGLASRERAYATRVDWVFISKYVEPEPSHGSWGGEETPTPPGAGPYPPTLTSPSNGTRFNPSATVVFSWVFNHPNQSESQSAYQFQLDNDADFSSPAIDTGKVQSSSQQTSQALPSAVGLYYWRVRVWDTQDRASNYSSAWYVIVDRLEVYGAWVSDSRADVGSTQYVYWQLRYDYDDVVFDNSKGTVKVNGESASWDSQNSRWQYATSKSTVGSYTYTLTFVDNAYGLTAITGTTSQTIIFDKLEVYDYGVSDGRANVGDSVIVWVKIRYAYDQQTLDGSKGSVAIGGQTATWNSQYGRWQISVSQTSVCKVDYQTPSSVTDSQYGLTVLAGQTTLSVIWDRVKVESSGAVDGRVNIGESDKVYFVLKYEYNSTIVSDGNVLVNGTAATYNPSLQRWELTVQSSTVCGKRYYVSSVSGNTYGITVLNHVASYPLVVWDRVKVESGGIAKQRADVGSYVKVYFVVRYEYDGALVTNGYVLVNGSSSYYNASASRWEYLATSQTVGRLGFQVSAVYGNTYGITVFTDLAGCQYCIWDRIQIYEAGATDDRADVGGTVYVWFRARYEYDQTLFTDSKGLLYVNGTQASFDGLKWVKTVSASTVCKRYYTVSGIVDNVYGLTAFKMDVNAPSVIFDKAIFTLTVSKTRINIGSSANITVSGVYAYDGAAFQGYVRLNDTELYKRSAGKWGFTVLAISDSLYGLTAFESNSVSIIWDGMAVYSQAVDLDRLLVAVRVKYAYDGLPIEGCQIIYGGLSAYTNASGWAVFSVWNFTRVVYGSSAYAASEPHYGLTYCSQSLAVQFAKETYDTFWVASNGQLQNVYWDWENRKLTFHTTGTAVIWTGGMGTPQKVEVNRQTWSNWQYTNGFVKIYGLSSYVVVSWPIPPKPQEPQAPPQYITMVSLSVGVVDLGTLKPGQNVTFAIPVSSNQTVKIVSAEPAFKQEWFTLLTALPFDVSSRGNNTIKFMLKIPANIYGSFNIPVEIKAVAEGTTLTATSYVKLTVSEAKAEAGLTEQVVGWLSDPTVIFLILLTILIVAVASRRR